MSHIEATVVWHPCPKCGHMTHIVAYEYWQQDDGAVKPKTVWGCTNKHCSWYGPKPLGDKPEKRNWYLRPAGSVKDRRH